MNTLLHLADSALQYHRGKQTGLWGLVGIVLALLIVAFWDLIQPIFEHIGLVSLLGKMGLIVEGDPGVTAFKIFIAALGFYLVLVIVGLVLLGILAIVSSVIQNEKLSLGILYAILSPLYIVLGILVLISSIINLWEKATDPTGYAERKRLEKNAKVIHFLKHDGAEEGQDNVLTYEQAYNRLNRLPTIGDYFFLLGITHKRDIFMLLPNAIERQGLGSPGEICCELLKIECVNEPSKKLNVQIVEDIDFLVDIPRIQLSDFEMIYSTKNKELLTAFEQYSRKDLYFRYIKKAQNHFFYMKDRFLKELNSDLSQEEYNAALQGLKDYRVSNEEIVKMIWEGNQKIESMEE